MDAPSFDFKVPHHTPSSTGTHATRASPYPTGRCCCCCCCSRRRRCLRRFYVRARRAAACTLYVQPHLLVRIRVMRVVMRVVLLVLLNMLMVSGSRV